MTRDAQALKLTPRQRSVLLYIHRNETPDFGVIVDPRIAGAFTRKGWTATGLRRKFARDSGACVRLTDEGYMVVRSIERVLA